MAMKYDYPHTIENGAGERLTFLGIVKDPQGDYLEVENFVTPGSGPPMHVHFLQDEHLIVVKGKMATLIQGGQPQYLSEGQSGTFPRGVAHRFWNAGDEPLIGRGWIKPIDNIEYFLTELFKSTKANNGKRPGLYDAVFLMSRYKTEFDMTEIPPFIKTFIFPVILAFGKIAGWDKKFADAPPPVSIDR